MYTNVGRLACLLGCALWLAACGDSATTPDAADSIAVDSRKDAGIDSPRADSAVDVPSVDTAADAPLDAALDAPAVDSTADSPAADSTVDQPVADSTVDQPVADSTVDQPVADSTVDQPVADSTVDQPPATSFSQVYSTVISPNCSCHIGGASGGLSMASQAVAYSNLVGVASNCNGAVRVVASSSATSLLYNKLEGSGSVFCGNRMPLGGAQLSATLRALVKKWIDDGANP